MATSNTQDRSSTLKEYEDRIAAQMRDAKAKLDQIAATARQKAAPTEASVVGSLKTAKDNIDRKLQDLKKTNDAHLTRAKADIDADVATFKASIDDYAAKFKTPAKK